MSKNDIRKREQVCGWSWGLKKRIICVVWTMKESAAEQL
jgi:hypothetical protein